MGMAAAMGPGAGGPGMGMGMPGGGMLGMGGGALGALGDGLGLSGGPAEPTYRVVAAPHSRSLLFRGTERDLQIVADVVTVLNTPADKSLPKLKSLRAYRLRFADPGELAQTFHQLELEANVQAGPPESKLLFVVGPEELLPEIEEAVKALDVEDKAPGRGM